MGRERVRRPPSDQLLNARRAGEIFLFPANSSLPTQKSPLSTPTDEEIQARKARKPPRQKPAKKATKNRPDNGADIAAPALSTLLLPAGNLLPIAATARQDIAPQPDVPPLAVDHAPPLASPVVEPVQAAALPDMTGISAPLPAIVESTVAEIAPAAPVGAGISPSSIQPAALPDTASTLPAPPATQDAQPPASGSAAAALPADTEMPPPAEATAKPDAAFSGTPARLASIKPPKPGEVILILDAATIIYLLQRIDGRSEGEGLIGIELIKKALDMPEIGKIIIPDYIADFEMRGTARRYNAKDAPFDSRSAQTLRPQQLKRFDTLISGAVRRHIDHDGNECFLTQPGVAPNENMVIWETANGRAMAEDICHIIYNERRPGEDKAIAENRGIMLVRDKYIAKSGPQASLEGKDRGELCIEEFTDNEIPWKGNPCLIVSGDSNYIRCSDHALTTRHGDPKLYMSTRVFVETALKQGGKELCDALHLQRDDDQLKHGDYQSQALTLCRRINELRRTDESEVLKDPPRFLRGDRKYFKEAAPALEALIPNNAVVLPQLERLWAEGAGAPPVNGKTVIPPSAAFLRPPVAANGHRAAARAPEEAATAAASTPGGAALQKAILNRMIALNITFDDIATEINNLTPHMPEMTPEMVHGILSGQHKILDDHFYAFMELLVKRNPHIKAEDKVNEALLLLDAYRHSAQEHDTYDSVIDREKYHALGNYVFDRMEQLGKTDFKSFARELNTEINAHHLKPEEKTIDGYAIGDILLGASPSAGLALALRKALHPEGADTLAFDQAYIAKKFAVSAKESKAPSF